jgi:hypothetical protein
MRGRRGGVVRTRVSKGFQWMEFSVGSYEQKLGIWHDMTIPTNMVTEVLSAWNWDCYGWDVSVEEQQIFGRFKCMFPHLNRDDASFCGLVLGAPSLEHSNNQRTIVSNDDCSVIAGIPRCSLRSHIDVQGKLART